MFGSGAVMPFNTTRDVVVLLNTLGNFYSHESWVNALLVVKALAMQSVSLMRLLMVKVMTVI